MHTLIKVCKELDIAMSTLTKWCEQNGYMVDPDPKYIISDELYEKLKLQFPNTQDRGIRLDSIGYCGIDTVNNDSDCYSQGDNDTLNDAFEGDVELYKDWLLN